MDIRTAGGQRPVVTAINLNRRQRRAEPEQLFALTAGDEREELTPEELREREKLEAEQRKAAEAERRKQEHEAKMREKQNEIEMLTQELENSNKEAEAMGESFKIYSRCLKIASRIARGDSVPMKDMKYLAEHEPDMFKQAILLRVPNDHPKKHKSVLDDEEEKKPESPDSGGSSSPEIAQPEGAPAPEIPEETASAEGDTGENVLH
ncbi:MAG: hypothetical protein K5876_01190 [Ruminiclostridium sp.]|nr:hypothetical protein [Ruminiclostridium sp.]